MQSITEVVDKQNEVIKIQSDIIDELFTLLSQHLTVDELSSLPVLNRMNQAATIRLKIE